MNWIFQNQPILDSNTSYRHFSLVDCETNNINQKGSGRTQCKNTLKNGNKFYWENLLWSICIRLIQNENTTQNSKSVKNRRFTCRILWNVHQNKQQQLLDVFLLNPLINLNFCWNFLFVNYFHLMIILFCLFCRW